MNKQSMLSPLYEQGKIKLAFGYSSRIAKRYYKTKQPTESQRDTIRKMLNPNMRLKCSSVVLHLALKDLAATAKQHLAVALTLRSEQAQVKATNAQTQKVLEKVTNGCSLELQRQLAAKKNQEYNRLEEERQTKANTAAEKAALKAAQARQKAITDTAKQTAKVLDEIEKGSIADLQKQIKISRPVPYIKNYRLQQLGIDAPLTAEQKRKIAATCNCTTEYVEKCISKDYQSIDYQMYLCIAREIGNHQYIKMYGRK